MAASSTYDHDDTTWNVLLDRLCVERGYHDNSALAEKLCQQSGNRTREAFETAQRNLVNWRNGTHVPQRRNFLVLTRSLEIEENKEVERLWNRLYTEARKKAGGNLKVDTRAEELHEITRDEKKGSDQVRRLQKTLAGCLICILALSATIIYLLSGEKPDNLGYDNIVYHRNVQMAVGEATVIHGRRAACGEMPPQWDVVREELPDVALGTWSDGGIGIRNSRSCGGPTPARALVFTATTPGTASFSLYDDPITIRAE